MARCAGTSKKGTPCGWQALKTGPLCLNCAGAAGDEEARIILRARGHKGQQKAEFRRESARLQTCDLRTTDGQLTQLEGALVRVANCDADAVQKAGAICKLIAEARSVMKDAVWEVENEGLRKALADKHPQLAKQLHVVR